MNAKYAQLITQLNNIIIMLSIENNMHKSNAMTREQYRDIELTGNGIKLLREGVSYLITGTEATK